MLFSFRRVCVPVALGLLSSALLLSSCSSPDSTTTGATQATAPAPPAFPFGGKVDSINGIAGHAFGEPLSSFSQLRPIPSTPGEPTKAYAYEGSAGWFGKHKAQVRALYYFLDGKFCHFRAYGDAAVLRPQVDYLFGPSKQEGKYRLFWEGSRARAAYIEEVRGFGWEGTLNVLSKPLEAALAAQERARLKAENAQ